MFGINKNGTKHKLGIIMPAFFPASRTTYDGTTSGLSATKVQGAIDAVEGQIANSSDAYSASKAYSVGDYCIYNDILYRCVTACSAASWAVNSSCFVADTVTSAINQINLARSYSTSETNTHQKWIDGRDVYRIVVSFTNKGNSSLILSGFTYEITKINLILHNRSDLSYVAGYANAYNYCGIYGSQSSGNVRLYCVPDNTYDGYCIIEYVK